MFRVMIVDDEPPIVRSVRRVLEKHCPELEVVAEACHGEEALALMAVHHPHVVFTDIRMPVMDGLTLASRIHALHPGVRTVIISGYEDFSYAREAMKSGVTDYLLKPVEPDILRELLDRLLLSLSGDYRSSGRQMLRHAAFSQDTGLSFQESDLQNRNYRPMLLRRGAYPRHGQHFSAPDPIQWSQACGCSAARVPSAEDIWYLPGRDDAEMLVLFPEHTPAAEARRTWMHLCPPELFSTAVTCDPVSFSKLYDAVRRLDTSMRQRVVIGLSQWLDLSSIAPDTILPTALLGSSLENKLIFLIQSKASSSLRDALMGLFLQWEQQQMPQMCLEKLLKQILHLTEKHASATPPAYPYDFQLEEVVSCATDFSSLLRAVWDILEIMLLPPETSGEHPAESGQLFVKIQDYICLNLSEALSLQGLCGLFGISQPYMSRLFRKFAGVSFNEFVTRQRITEAKRLILAHPDMRLRDVAEIVGYQDPHYFSRIFKTVTGQSPSEFSDSPEET